MIDPKRPQYSKAYQALESAHQACFDHPDRGPLGMSHGPFSGVNVALGVVSELEREITELKNTLKSFAGKTCLVSYDEATDTIELTPCST